MTSRLRRHSASLGAVVLAALGLALLSPAAAQAATTNYTLDCFALPDYSSQTLYVAPGDTITIASSGFDDLWDWNTGTSRQALNPAGDSAVLSAGDSVEFWDSTSTCADTFDIDVEEAQPQTLPSGSLLFTQSITLPAGTTAQIDLADNTGGNGHDLAGDPNCNLSTDVHGSHVYGKLDVTVLTAGTYTFRGLFSTPGGSYVGLNPYDPMEDPFLAVYSAFDPTNPDTGVLGCNDDLNDLGPMNDAEFLSDNSIIEGHQPYFTASFTPGTYTLVLMTWEDMNAANWASGNSPWGPSVFTPGAKSTTFQLWGPVGGLSLGSSTPSGGSGVSGSGLAETGATLNPVALGGAAAAILVGVTLLLLPRRRRRAARHL